MKKMCLTTLIVPGGCLTGLRAQDGSISKPLQFRLPVETFVRNYVEPRLATWMKWDRYEESGARHRERMQEDSKKQKISAWEQEALRVSGPEFYFSGNTVGLDRPTFTLPSTGQQFVYNSREQHPYTDMNIACEQGPVEISLDGAVRPPQAIARNTAVTGSPDVDARIPKTGAIHTAARSPCRPP
jgi:hypothetical protein